MIKKLFGLFGLALLFTSCEKGNEIGEVQGWQPQYVPLSELTNISSSSAKAIENGGNIVLSGNKLYMVEDGKGVHIISYANPNNPVKERFISIPGCYQATIKDGYLLANNHTDLISIDLSSASTATVKSRINNVFEDIGQDRNVPPQAARGDYFECYDAQKGVLKEWKKTTIKNPKCRITN